MNKEKEARAIQYLQSFEEKVMKWWIGDDPNQIELNFDFTEE